MTADNTTSTMHTSQDRTSADNAILSGNAQPTTPEQKDHADNWALFSTCNIRGASWVNIMGWYQSAGDGSFFTVLNETVNGKQVPVLFSASGAEAWTDAHYYLSADLATAQKNTKYAEDHSRDDDDDSNSDSQSNDDDSSDQTDDNDSDSQQDDSDTQSDNDNNSVDTNDDNDDDDY
ncbi:hypothetical protein IV55_GL000388 [Furfurilactobacillus siliginis]|nr:hypothetical protein IV55_GL000388 [Furfurilactobacillus siliginis]